MLTEEGSGARLIERAKTFQEESNPFLPSSETNPFFGASSSENVSSSVQPSDRGNDWVDLLTGEGTFSDHIAQSVTGCDVDKGGDLLDFLDQAVVEYNGAEVGSKFPSTNDGRTSESGSQQYINCLRSLAGSQMVCYCLCSFLSKN